jgi:pyrroline-5-carboxylate reductase
MAASLIGGLIADGMAAGNIAVADIDDSRLQHLHERFGIQIFGDANAAVQNADTVVFSVKPQTVKTVARELAEVIRQKQLLVISIAAGICTADIERWLGGDTAVVRAMPNTPALVQCSATGLFANDNVSAEQRDQAEIVLRATGLTVWLENEAQMNVVTALSGSGPAYFFRIMESMENAAEKLGLPVQTARLLTLQTALGAAKLAMETSDDLAQLRQSVTSPGGTTEQGLKIMNEKNIDEFMEAVIKAACERAEQLAEQLGSE